MRINLVPNPSFETDINGWGSVAGDGTVSLATDRAWSGNNCLKVVSGTNTNELLGVEYSFINVSPSTTYTISAYAQGDGTASMFFYLVAYIYDAADVLLSSNGGTMVALPTDGSWVRNSYTFTTPANASYIELSPHFADGVNAIMPAGLTFHVDAVMMEEASSLQDYFDGSYNGYQWSGIPHASTSETYVPFPVLEQGPNELLLEVEVPTEGLPNLIPNPSGDKGAWGWVTPINNTTIQNLEDANGPYLRFLTTAAQAAYWTSEFVAATAGDVVAARFDTVGGTASPYNVKVKYEFYNSAKVLLSSSAQSVAFYNTAQTNYAPSVTAPANTEYVKLRFDFYNGTSNPGSQTSYLFRRVMLTNASTASDLVTTRTNLWTNPSFETNTTGITVLQNGSGGSGYVASRQSSEKVYGTYSMRLRNGSLVESVVWRGPGIRLSDINVTGGQTYTMQYNVKYTGDAWYTAPKMVVKMQWLNSAGSTISTSTSSQASITRNAWNMKTYTATAPSTATKVRIEIVDAVGSPRLGFSQPNVDMYFDGLMLEKATSAGTYFDGSTTDTASRVYDWTGTAHASTSTETTTTAGTVEFEYSDPNDWQNILGPTHEIKVSRGGLDVGLMSAVILDPLLDPAVADFVRPGKQIRLRALVDDEWESVYEGKITNAKVTYPKDKKAGAVVEPRIEISASDNMAHLANQSEVRGVAGVSDLPFILEGKGAPWNVNGSGEQVTTATIVSYNENASIVDQIAIARDSVMGYAWVDRNNVMNVWDNNQLATTPVVTFSDASTVDPDWTSYTDIDVDFDTEACINDVLVKWLRYDAGTGATEEIAYGPYQDAPSIRTWGARSATFTIGGLTESATAIQDYATAVLAANSTPQIRCRELTMPVRNDKERGHAAVLDLYSPVAVKYDNKVDTTLRITSIEHTITPGKWTVTYGFDVQGSVAQPTYVPSPPFKGTTQTTALFNDIRTKNIHADSTADANTSAGNNPALKVGAADGVHLRIDGNEIIAMSDDSTPSNLGLNGKFFSKFDYGITTQSTGTTGYINVSHSMGKKATIAIAQPSSFYGQQYRFIYDDAGSTSTYNRWLVKNHDNTAVTSTQFTFVWFTIAA